MNMLMLAFWAVTPCGRLGIISKYAADGNSMFVWNFDIYLQVPTASRSTSTVAQ